MNDGTVYSTSECAKILRFSPRKISQLIDKGLLKGYRIPGSKHRRVTREELNKFIEQYKMSHCVIRHD